MHTISNNSNYNPKHTIYFVVVMWFIVMFIFASCSRLKHSVAEHVGYTIKPDISTNDFDEFHEFVLDSFEDRKCFEVWHTDTIINAKYIICP